MAGVTFPAGVIITDRIQLESDAATGVYEALQGRTTILSIVAVEVGGANVTLSVEVTDGVQSWFLQKDVDMKARGEVTLRTVIALNNNEALKVTSSDPDGNVHVFVTYCSPFAAAR